MGRSTDPCVSPRHRHRIHLMAAMCGPRGGCGRSPCLCNRPGWWFFWGGVGFRPTGIESSSLSDVLDWTVVCRFPARWPLSAARQAEVRSCGKFLEAVGLMGKCGECCLTTPGVDLIVLGSAADTSQSDNSFKQTPRRVRTRIRTKPESLEISSFHFLAKQRR
jgi:hypothetical protein